ncbi:pseudouridylate synthase [Sphingobacterium sp. DK4209]|uniref:tRNA pseudouridine synthase C n=1 Tax=Sphingobacterium zhuxiongii TaxID=2662364 RepID=A0A5Q0Q5U4_9SPHI|nr:MULTISPECIES: pseudouridine synthase [unclassified Sphingobacterium]MVZ65823.1 pseudouridylate synthase [Sphingobacterium sp. DK4209]QGA24833.1 pseudouridylate synthase [Sphingobacterium sp. dk4302]
MLEILYEDQDLIAINKPHGLLVHRSSIAADTSEFALQILRDQIGRMVRPAHRLDRKTAGVLLFSLNKEMDSLIQQAFANNRIEKEYLAVLRGFSQLKETIDYPLKKENGAIQEAVTHFETIKHAEIDLPFGKHATSRYSLIKANPQTGRMHQLRRHFAHILHPIIGDRPHGCNKQNKLWKETFEHDTMLLHASSIKFTQPKTGELVEIRANLQPEFERALTILKITTF